MNHEGRISIIWSPAARLDLRAIEKDEAMQILHCIGRYLSTRDGDVEKLKPPLTGLRLRCGDYRIFFEAKPADTIEITRVRNRRDAYR